MRTKHQVSAGGVLVRRTREGPQTLLAARRLRSGELAWGLPKGLVEEGESLEETARREVLEETGWEGNTVATLGEIAYWFVWEGERIHKTVHFFLMEAQGGDTSRRDREMEDVRWFPLEEARKVVRFASEREVLAWAAAAASGREG